jgi:hypothetical protein
MLPLVLPSPLTRIREQSFYLPGPNIHIEYPEESRMDENYAVTITIVPFPYKASSKIFINSITVVFYNPIHRETILSNTELTSKFSKTFNLKPAFLGSSKFLISCDYIVDKGTADERSYEFTLVTYLTEIRGEKTYDELEDAYRNLKWNYENLNSSYYSLEKDYSNLRAKCDEQINILGIFSLTTIIFLLTTVYFVWEYRQLKKRQGESYRGKENLLKR